jgi:prepilin-type N-terminal cleavage/methylation domain-containing protein
MRRPARGFSLVELMIAMALASVVSAFLLMLTRSQLVAYQLNDQLTKAQQNGRAGLGFVETMLRRSCAGASYGAIGVNVPGVAQAVVPCVRFFDGATLSGGSFAVGDPTTQPDAIEVLYGTTPIATVTQVDNVGSANPDVHVTDATGFANGNYVLVTNYQQAELFQIDNITINSPTDTLITFKPLGGNEVAPNYSATAAALAPFVMQAGQTMLRAASASLYVSTVAPYDNMLMFDPDGMLGTAHDDAQPLVENVTDFQLAFGVDNAPLGTLEVADWMGDAAGEDLPALPWNWDPTSVVPPVRAIRASLMVRTAQGSNGTGNFAGDAPALPLLEDRTTYPAVGPNTPRYRTLRIEVLPRVWNLGN